MHDHAVANRWAQLSPEIIRCIASFIDPAEVAGAVKLINKATAAVLRESREIRLGGVATVYRSDASTSDPNLSLSVDLAAQPWPRAAFLAHWSSPSAWRTLNLLQRRRLVNLAASSGDAESLETALAHCGCSLTKGALTSAAAAGCVAACETLWAQGCDGDLSEALTASASAGQLQALEWLLRHSLRAGTNRRRRRRAGRHRRWRWRSATPDYFGLGVTACRGGHAHVLSEVERQAAASRSPFGLERTRFYDCCGYAAAAGGHTELISRLTPRLEARLVEWKWYRNAADEDDGRYVYDDITVAFRLREVMKAAAHGCSLEALRHYYHKWSRWVWYVEDPEEDGDSEEEEEEEEEEDSRWGGREPSPVVGPEQRAREVLLPLVAAAAGSPTPDAFDKVDWLLAEMRRHAAAAAAAAPDGRAGAARAAAAAVDAHGGAAAATVPSPIAALPVSAAAKQPDFLQRLQQLESRGFADFVGAASAAAAEGRAEALAYLLQRAPAVAQVGPARDLLLEAAGRGGHVAVLRVLCEHGVAEDPGELLADAPALLRHPGFLRAAPLDWVPDVKYAAMCQLEQELGSDDAGMDEGFRDEGLAQLFQDAVVAGAGLPVLRALQEEGVPVDLAAVAAAGSEEALEWAAAVLREQEGGTLEPLSAEQLWHCVCGDYPGPGNLKIINGNFAAAAWLQEHGLAPYLGLAFTMARLQQPQTLRLQPSPQPPPRFQQLRWVLPQQPGCWGGLAAGDWRKVLACVEQLVKAGAAWPHQLTWLQQRWLQEAQARLAEAEAEVAAGRLGRSWEEALSKARAEVQAARAGKW